MNAFSVYVLTESLGDRAVEPADLDVLGIGVSLYAVWHSSRSDKTHLGFNPTFLFAYFCPTPAFQHDKALLVFMYAGSHIL